MGDRYFFRSHSRLRDHWGRCPIQLTQSQSPLTHCQSLPLTATQSQSPLTHCKSLPLTATQSQSPLTHCQSLPLTATQSQSPLSSPPLKNTPHSFIASLTCILTADLLLVHNSSLFAYYCLTIDSVLTQY